MRAASSRRRRPNRRRHVARVSSSSGGYLSSSSSSSSSGKKIIILSFPFCFGETKRRRDLFDSLSLSLSKIVLLSGFLQRWSSSSLAVVFVVYVVREQKKRRLVGLSGLREGGRRCSSARGGV